MCQHSACNFMSCLQLDKMDASARSKAEMAQKIAEQLLKSSSHRMGAPQTMPLLSSDQSNIVRAAQQKAAEIAVQASSLLHASACNLSQGICDVVTKGYLDVDLAITGPQTSQYPLLHASACMHAFLTVACEPKPEGFINS